MDLRKAKWFYESLISILGGAMDNTDRLAVLIDADIVKQSPEFDPSNYGYGKVGELDIATKLLKLKKGKLGMAIQNLCISATKEKNWPNRPATS